MTTVLELAAVGLVCGFAWFLWPPLILLILAVFVGFVAWRRESAR